MAYISTKMAESSTYEGLSKSILTMAMLVELLMGIKDPGKVQNWHVTKLWIAFFPIVILFLVKSLFHNSSFMDVDTAV